VVGEEEGIEMSDTPRTDAYNWDNGNYDDPLHAWFDFSRQLERELNAANEHIKLLKSSGNELIEWLKDGAISDSNYRLLANAWQRAKENKQ
jgi:hypothetical protein